jgi:hypothetical protein
MSCYLSQSDMSAAIGATDWAYSRKRIPPKGRSGHAMRRKPKFGYTLHKKVTLDYLADMATLVRNGDGADALSHFPCSFLSAHYDGCSSFSGLRLLPPTQEDKSAHRARFKGEDGGSVYVTEKNDSKEYDCDFYEISPCNLDMKMLKNKVNSTSFSSSFKLRLLKRILQKGAYSNPSERCVRLTRNVLSLFPGLLLVRHPIFWFCESLGPESLASLWVSNRMG